MKVELHIESNIEEFHSPKYEQSIYLYGFFLSPSLEILSYRYYTGVRRIFFKNRIVMITFRLNLSYGVSIPPTEGARNFLYEN